MRFFMLKNILSLHFLLNLNDDVQRKTKQIL